MSWKKLRNKLNIFVVQEKHLKKFVGNDLVLLLAYLHLWKLNSITVSLQDIQTRAWNKLLLWKKTLNNKASYSAYAFRKQRLIVEWIIEVCVCGSLNSMVSFWSTFQRRWLIQLNKGLFQYRTFFSKENNSNLMIFRHIVVESITA